jgi:hypothetical protein
MLVRRSACSAHGAPTLRDMTLFLPALLLAVVISMTGVAGGAQLHLILPLLLLAHFGVSKGHDRSARRSMNLYLETVVADLDSLSLRPTSARFARKHA